jgi:DNA-binding NarL/FixJ family response regulator/TolA-binding protein
MLGPQPLGPENVTILLADEDTLRCEGLAAVLRATSQFEVISVCADGEVAMDQIRRSRPHVAVIDLNLAKVHGIELIRRIRSEALATKVIILSGTDDDDLIREVVRAGGDGYLLKNGPARHLIDAISYVRDGGQYFSPQLRRDGLDRHLLEHTVPVMQRDRFRGDGDTDGHDGRDYQILSMVADGLRPVLDRLEEIERRMADVKTGAETASGNGRLWLNKQTGDTLTDPRAALTARLPELVEKAVANRFNGITSRLQERIEETHAQTLEAFVRNIQVKLVQRVSALETDIVKQSIAMNELREYSQRTEDGLSRLIAGVDKLAQELPGRLQVSEYQAQSSPEPQPVRRKSHRKSRAWWLLIALVLVTGALVVKRLYHAKAGGDSQVAERVQGKPVVPPPDADTNTKMQAAKQYTESKDYAVAESIYRQVLKADPKDPDAMKGLASVLYREDKIDESATILDKLPPN